LDGIEVVIAFKIAGSRASRQPHVIYPFEEKILQLQNRKKTLMDALVESEHPMMEGLTMDDIAGLLDL